MRRPLGRNDRVLVRVPSWLGDAVQSEPALRALVAHVGEANLTLAATANVQRLFEGAFPEARRVASADVAAWRGHDVALLLTGSFRSAWTAFAAGIPRRVGWARDARGFLLTDCATPSRERGAAPLGIGTVGRGRRYLPRPFGASCSELLGLVGVGVSDPMPRLTLPSEVHSRVNARLRQVGIELDRRFALASVGGRVGSAKAFPVESWSRALAAFAARASTPVVLCCGPGEETRVAAIVEAAATTRLYPLGPVGLRELGALAQQASVVLVADSGPRHIAIAAGARIATVAGPTDPRHTADQLARQSVLRVEVPCGPCHAETCRVRGEGELACMRRIDPEEFARRALALAE